MASHNLGVRATDAVIDARGEIPLFRDLPSPGKNRFDEVGVDLEELTLTAYESKGGDSGLGKARINGVDYQQGTGPYLQKLFNSDPRFVQRLAEVLEAAGERGNAFVRALEDGSLKIHYDLVQARRSGKIELSRFDIGDTPPELPPLPGGSG